jgi:hypothetical protein
MMALKSNIRFRMALRRRVFFHFVMVITLFGILGTLLGVILIDRTTLNEAQRRVSIDLHPPGASSTTTSTISGFSSVCSAPGAGSRTPSLLRPPKRTGRPSKRSGVSSVSIFSP